MNSPQDANDKGERQLSPDVRDRCKSAVDVLVKEGSKHRAQTSSSLDKGMRYATGVSDVLEEASEILRKIMLDNSKQLEAITNKVPC